MKKLNVKGFTLIELLAVITIMGILMLVAIPTVSRTIENSRKDTFIDTVKQYVNGAKNMWASDNLSCDGVASSAVEASDKPYCIVIRKDFLDSPILLEQGGDSPWGGREMRGVIFVKVVDDVVGTSTTRKVMYYPAITDGVHGINVPISGDRESISFSDSLKESDNLVRGDLVMSGAVHFAVESGVCAARCIDN